MRLFWLISLVFVALFGSNVVIVEDQFKESGKCKACHSHIVKEWESSWHAKSHYEKDEYFQKTIDYIARKDNTKTLNSIKIECAACHNPRISVTSTTAEYDAIASLGLDKDSAIAKAVASGDIVEGINCVVCHNIDNINDHLPETKRGINRVSWLKSGVMSGPYDDTSSPYHKVIHRDFMNKDSNKLCFVCHANDRSSEGFVFTNMKNEYKGDKQCVDCHMGPKKAGVASTLPIDNGKPRARNIREHGFIGAHTEDMWKNALKVDTRKSAKNLEVLLTNPQPHALPSGFGAREIIIEIDYLKSSKTIKSEKLSLSTKYLNKRGKPTIPHLAAKTLKPFSIAAGETKSYSFAIANGADEAKVSVYYRLVNDEVRDMLALKQSIWSKKFEIKIIKAKL